MSDDGQGEAMGRDETDISIDEDAATPPADSATADPTATPAATATAVKVPSGAPPAAGGPPPAAGGPPLAKSAVAAAVEPATKADQAAAPAAVLTDPAPAEPPAATAASPAAPAVVGADGIHVLFSGMTSVGLVREHNEDNLVIADLSTKARHPPSETIACSVTPAGLLFAVCDGMGGAAAGEVASQMAVDFLYEDLAGATFGGDRDALARQLVSTVERAGKQIFDTAQADRSRRGMGTTSTVAVLLDQVLFVGQVGDSRAYVLRGGTLKQVTKDQSLVNQLIEAGHLTEEEAEGFEHSNVILQALGTTEKVTVDLTFVELRQGDRLMMCSDGLSGLVRADVIAETLRTIGDPVACCVRLTELANEGSGHDNITIVIADFSGNGLLPAQSGETAGYNQYPLLPVGTDAAPATSAATDGARAPAGGDASSAERGGAGQWWLMGLVAILFGVGIAWWWENKQSPMPDVAPDQAPVEPLEQAPEPDEEAQLPEPELVPAHISTDAEAGLLVIDGEPRGPLAVGAPRELDLAPGSYRIELQIDGSVAVSRVVAVESGKPLDVELSLPSGATGSPEPSGVVAPDDSAPAVRRPRSAPIPGAAPSAATPRAPSLPPVPATPKAPTSPVPAPVAAPIAPARPAVAPATGSTSTVKAAPVAAAKRALPANPF